VWQVYIHAFLLDNFRLAVKLLYMLHIRIDTGLLAACLLLACCLLAACLLLAGLLACWLDGLIE